MFLKTSRYYQLTSVEVTLKDGRTAKAIPLRFLPETEGNATTVKGNDRLDILAQSRYDNGSMFWHIADANTELEANDLVKTPGQSIMIPET